MHVFNKKLMINLCIEKKLYIYGYLTYQEVIMFIFLFILFYLILFYFDKKK